MEKDAPYDYYEALGIGRDATQSEIKKSYYEKARKCHPDKCPDNPELEAEFKKISQAYSVLSDPEKRKIYDLHGSYDDVAGDRPYTQEQIHALLQSIFGDGNFDDIFGRAFAGLEYILSMKQNDEDIPSMSPEELNQRNLEAQEKNVEEVYDRMRTKLFSFDPDHVDKFKNEIEIDLKGKLEVPGGVKLLKLCGWTLKNEAKKHSGGKLSWSRLSANVSEKKRFLSTNLKTIACFVTLDGAERRLQMNPEDQDALKDIAEKSFGIVWILGLINIEMTIRAVCKKLLSDPSLSKEQVNKHKKAIAFLGKMYYDAAKSHGDSSKSSIPVINIQGD
ncbi:uncharacterized protein LOC126315328 [Schistocerca gregaria]|uniref:uncharacterized protein LOC126315328 n=1 Tax=Schistocerca gregaria TaxID=7010 RepID=UPI00211E405D|nr:uncharacterized protein LOC126315328 [Schistocerca gregaria]